MNRSTNSAAPATKAPPRLVRIQEVKRRTSLGRSTIYALIQKGQFPKQVQLTTHKASAWLESEVTEWIEGRMNSRALGAVHG